VWLTFASVADHLCCRAVSTESGGAGRHPQLRWAPW
jgi:hypothetical protein